MLQNIREKTSGWIAYVIIGLISIPFVLAGITSYFGGGDLAPAAIVDGEEISSRQLDFAYRNYQQRLRSMFGGEIPQGLDNEAVLKEQVRNQLIDEQVLSQYVSDQNFRVSDQTLNKKITTMSIFQVDGRFDSETYQGQLRSQGLVPQQFEEDLRRSEEMTQIRRAFRGTSITSKTRSDEQQALALQLRNVSSLVLSIDVDSVTVTDEEIAKEYQANSSQYMTTERVKIDYIELSIESLRENISVTEKQLKDYYEQVKEDLTSTEARAASHILLQLNEDASDDLIAEKKALALDLKQQIIEGASFEALAKKNSDDPGSADEGGDLGDVEKGTMVAPFEDALFSMNIGDVSEPIRTTFGWHIIKLNAISGGDTPSFESMRFELAEQLKTEQAENKIYELSEQLSNLTYEQADSLVPAAEQLELIVKTSDWFVRNSGDGIANNPKVRELAFSSSVLQEGKNSETLELGDNNIVVIHLNEHQPSALPPLDDIKEALVKSLKVKKSRLLTAEKGKKGLQQAKVEGLASVAKDWQQDIKANGFIKRDARTEQQSIVDLAFKMPKPNGASSFQGIELASGDYAIIEVSDIKLDTAEAEGSKKKSESGSYEYQAWLKDKVVNAKVIKTPLGELR